MYDVPQNHIQQPIYLILSHCSICVENPPHSMTVAMTMTNVVVNIRHCLSFAVVVFRMDSAKAIAPLRPGQKENQE